MPAAPFLTPDQHEEFKRRGILRLPALLGADVVRCARECVFDQLAEIGVVEAGGWQLPDGYADRKRHEIVDNKRSAIETLQEGPRLLGVVDELLGHHPFDPTVYPRPWVLFTPPNAQVWTAPQAGRWHVDAQRLPSGEALGVQVFAFLDTVTPGGGGPVAVAGSHRLLNDGRYIRMREIGGLLGQEAFFQRLYAAGADERAAAMAQPGFVNGVEQNVVELTGEPGDAYFTDVRVLHAHAPNATDRPRVMITQRFFRADLIRWLRDFLAQRPKVETGPALSLPARIKSGAG